MMIFTCGTVAIINMLNAPIASKSATEIGKNGGKNLIETPKRKKRRSSGFVDSINNSSCTLKSPPSCSQLDSSNNNIIYDYDSLPPQSHNAIIASTPSMGGATFSSSSASSSTSSVFIAGDAIKTPSPTKIAFHHHGLLASSSTSNFRGGLQHKTLSVNESFSLPSINASPSSALAQRRGAARDAFSGALNEMGDFELLEVLGEGFFGVVYKVREKANPKADPIVMKVPIMRDQPNLPPQSAKKIANKEDYMLTVLSHPNILKSKGLCVQRSQMHWQLNLLVEFCDGGSLQQTILGPKPMPWLQLAHIALDICRAMEYVHGKGFLHRDLTSMNVLLKSRSDLSSSTDVRHFPLAVVADFGLSTKIPDSSSTVLQQVGTQNWMAPEVLKEQFYNEKADLFSFGIILCQMIARIDADHDAGLYRTSDFGIDFVKFAQQKCPKDAPMDLLGAAYECCLCDPTSRPPFSALRRRFSTKIIPNLEKLSKPTDAEENGNNCTLARGNLSMSSFCPSSSPSPPPLLPF